MRILICHGYLLRGTGSNQYVQSLARALCASGEHVIVMCEDGDPGLDFVSVFLRQKPGGMGPEIVWEKDTPYRGTCMVFRPEIGKLLPVYVLDSYEGFEVKEFPDLDEEELDNYVDRNREALERLVEQFVPDVVLVNHTVMLPYIVEPIAGEAGIPYFVVVHGSAIEFTVKKDPRYLVYGADGLRGASGLFVPSGHSADVVRDVFGHLVEGLDLKIVMIPPGVDTRLFDATDESLSRSAERLLELVEERTVSVTVGDFVGHRSEDELTEDPIGRIESEAERIKALHPEWLPETDIADRLEKLCEPEKQFLMFLGKLLETKGIQCILPAMPLLLRDYPDVDLVVVGFGELRGVLELMIRALDAGDVRVLKSICEYANERYDRAGPLFDPVLSFLDEMAGEGTLDDFIELCRRVDIGDSIIFTGYLTPEEHRFLLPHAAALLVPSLAPEAFGLVATEAMAAGTLPIASRHSGLETALEPVRKVWGKEADEFFLGDKKKMVFRIAAASRRVLDLPREVLEEKGRMMRREVRESFSWEAVTERMTTLFRESARGGS